MDPQNTSFSTESTPRSDNLKSPTTESQGVVGKDHSGHEYSLGDTSAIGPVINGLFKERVDRLEFIFSGKSSNKPLDFGAESYDEIKDTAERLSKSADELFGPRQAKDSDKDISQPFSKSADELFSPPPSPQAKDSDKEISQP